MPSWPWSLRTQHDNALLSSMAQVWLPPALIDSHVASPGTPVGRMQRMVGFLDAMELTGTGPAEVPDEAMAMRLTHADRYLSDHRCTF
ncbi:MAG: hypothetical protein QOF70_7847 [Acetobacteraceae bacterium]|nr:hypothetical protein [Acetobacteraceae bacterium]